MRNNQQNPHLVGTGGKENDLKIWDLSRGGENIFKAKNVSLVVIESMSGNLLNSLLFCSFLRGICRIFQRGSKNLKSCHFACPLWNAERKKQSSETPNKIIKQQQRTDCSTTFLKIFIAPFTKEDHRHPRTPHSHAPASISWLPTLSYAVFLEIKKCATVLLKDLFICQILSQFITLSLSMTQVRNDTLDLHVPVWVTSLGFLPNTGSRVITGTGYHQIRLYDTSAKKRPVLSVDFEDCPISALAVTNQDQWVCLSDGFLVSYNEL